MTVLNQWLSNSSWQTSALRLRKLKDLIQEREAEREQKATEREERRSPAPVLIQHPVKLNQVILGLLQNYRQDCLITIENQDLI